MILAIGEILIDVFPHYSRIGGAPFNFAYHVKNLGMDVTLLTRVGDDTTGADIYSMLEKSGFDTGFVQIDQNHDTGRVIVTPDKKGGHEFDIRQNAAYDHIVFPGDPAAISGGREVNLIYFGTLIQRSASGFNRLQTFLGNRDPGSKCFYDINLRRGNFRDEALLKSLEKTDILKLNKDELDYIRSMFHRDHADLTLARWIMQHFGIELVTLTKGADGSHIITADEQHHAHVPDFYVADTVGAGDAYAAVIAVGYLKGLPYNAIIKTATEFSAGICTIKGAIPEDPEFYEPFRKQLSGAANV